MADGFRLPDDSHRITIIGKTGSGKTQGAAWLLSKRSFDKVPWLIFNWKHDDLLDGLPGVKPQVLKPDKLPKEPGLYMLHPVPDRDDEAVEDFLWAVWERGRMGLFIDEGYMLDRMSAPFQAILTQGRSKRLPVITLTQRPSWLTRFAFSEADFVQLYGLTDQRDIKTVRDFMPLPIEKPLPAPYWSWWWDNGHNYKAMLQPVPHRNIIMRDFHARTHVRRRQI